MSKFCSNCGNKLDDKAVICVKCGTSTEYIDVPKKIKVPGKGLSIASMTVGIVSLFNSITMCFSLPFSMLIFNEMAMDIGVVKIMTILLCMIFPLASSITALSLGLSSLSKIKNGFNKTGIITSSIALFLCIITLIVSIFV